MPKPITPFCGCDTFIQDEQNRVLLIKRSDNNFWAMPGGTQELSETPAACAVRECFEETGFHVSLQKLLGVWSSQRYEYRNYPWKDNQFTHLVFSACITGGAATPSAESTEIAWFHPESLPPLSDGHLPRILFSLKAVKDGSLPAYFE